MKLSLSCLFLMFGVFPSSLATFQEDCRALITPHATFPPPFGRWNFIIGYIDSKPFQTLFHSTLSQWIEFRQSFSNPLQLFEDIGIRHPTYCKYATSPVTLHQNTALADKSNFTCTYHSLPTCDDCLLYYVRSRNNNFFGYMGITNPQTTQEVKQYEALYLMARRKTLEFAELEYFKRQANCLGFSGPPNFHYDPSDPFC